MNVLIIDDDIDFCERLQRDYFNYFSLLDERIECKVIHTCFHRALLFDKPDIVFVDVDLVNENGINVADNIKKENPLALIIFMSYNEDFVFDTLGLQIFDFIRKKDYRDDIKRVFEHLKRYLTMTIKRSIIKYEDRNIVISFYNIEYILAIGRYLTIKTIDSEYLVQSSIQKFIGDIKYLGFYQIQKNMIINFHHVKFVNKTEVIMNDDKKYTIGRKYRTDIMGKYEEFLLR